MVAAGCSSTTAAKAPNPRQEGEEPIPTVPTATQAVTRCNRESAAQAPTPTHPFGSAGAALSETEVYTVTFTGPAGTWTATRASKIAAAREAWAQFQLGTVTATRIEAQA